MKRDFTTKMLEPSNCNIYVAITGFLDLSHIEQKVHNIIVEFTHKYNTYVQFVCS
ncbi:hypothetical protein M2140_000194 [Clostridiales Family XIII bacterium PM5-7]